MRMSELEARFGGDTVAYYMAQFILSYFYGVGQSMGPRPLDSYADADSWLEALGIEGGPYAWMRPREVPGKFWCTREDFLEVMTQAHGKDTVLKVLMVLEGT